MNKQTAIEYTQARKALVELIWSDMNEDDTNDNATMARMITERLGYKTRIIHKRAELVNADVVELGYIVISNESDDRGWIFVDDTAELTNFYENFDEWDLHNGEGVVIVYLTKSIKMKPHKYTHKEINDASMAARKAAEQIYSVDKVKAMHPIDKSNKIEARMTSTTFSRYTEYSIDALLEQFEHERKCGATHLTFSWSNAEWADEEPLDVETLKMKTETPDEYAVRIANIREKYLNDAYAKVQNEMVRHNEQLNLYLSLKEKFEPVK